MFRRILSRSSSILIRHFSDNKPPKGFEKFFKNNRPSPKPPVSQNDAPKTINLPESDKDAENLKKEQPNSEDLSNADQKHQSENKSAQPEDQPKSSKPESDDSKSKNDKKDDSKKKKSSNDKKSTMFNSSQNPNFDPMNFLLIGGIILASSLLYKDGAQINDKDISYAKFISDLLPSGKVKYVVIKTPKNTMQNKLISVLIQDKNYETIGILKINDISSFVSMIDSQNIGPDGKPVFQIIFQEASETDFGGGDEKFSSAGLLSFTLTVFMASLIYSYFKKGKGPSGMGSGQSSFKDIFGMGRSLFKVYGTDKKIDITFKDVAGQGQAKKEITEFVEFLKNPEKFKRLGARMPRGALLVGPPGTGKTLLAKASAGEAGVPFITTSGSEFVEMFVGVGASRVRDLFKQAREKAPSIIFIDEIDAVGRKRDDSRFRNDERDTTLNQLLVEMDGFQTDTYVVVMAATNRQDTLDSALLRPGRFDRIVEVGLPDIKGREEILHVHLKPLTLSPDFDIKACAKRVAALTPGFSGADLSQLCNEAAILAARENKNSVERIDFEKASEKVMLGVESSKKLSPKEKKIVSYHEAGHAVTGWFLEGADPVIKVSILPRSKGALGFAQNLPKDTPLYTEKEFYDKICMILGGRVSEIIFFGDVTNGASDDLKKATQLAQTLIETFGMGKISGLVSYNLNERYYSESTKDKLETEVKNIIDTCMQRTLDLLTEKKQLVESLAERLIEKEGVTHTDLVEILGRRPFEESEEYKTYVKENTNIE